MPNNVHIVILLSCALNAVAAPPPPRQHQYQRETSSSPTNNLTSSSSKSHPSHQRSILMDSSGAAGPRKRRDTSNKNADDHFNTTLPRRLNVHDTIYISGQISGGIKIHLLTEDKEIEGRLESDYESKTVKLKSHYNNNEDATSLYGEFEKDQHIQLVLLIEEDNTINVYGWDYTFLGVFLNKYHHSKLKYMHILGDIRNVVLTYKYN